MKALLPIIDLSFNTYFGKSMDYDREVALATTQQQSVGLMTQEAALTMGSGALIWLGGGAACFTFSAFWSASICRQENMVIKLPLFGA